MLAIPRHTVNLPLKALPVIFRGVRDKEIISGPGISKFEEKFASYIGVKYALSIPCARKGIEILIEPLGLAEGDEVILPAYTFHAVPELIEFRGLKPVFVDVVPDTGNINPDLIAEKITSKTKAIILTHMAGQPCQLDEITSIAAQYGLDVIEDCAHALGAEYHSKKTGSLGRAGVFSFGPGKVMPCFGGGMVTTNDYDLYFKLKQAAAEFAAPSAKYIFKNIVSTLVYHCFTKRRLFTCITYPAIRLLDLLKNRGVDDILKKETAMPYSRQSKAVSFANLQAEIGLFQLGRVDYVNSRLLANSEFYSKELSSLANIKVPLTISGVKSPYLYYKIRTGQAEKLRKFLLKRGVDTKADDMSFCPGLAAFKNEGGKYPVAESLPGSTLEIPSNYLLEHRDLEYIVECLKEADSCL